STFCRISKDSGSISDREELRISSAFSLDGIAPMRHGGSDQLLPIVLALEAAKPMNLRAGRDGRGCPIGQARRTTRWPHWPSLFPAEEAQRTSEESDTHARGHI